MYQRTKESKPLQDIKQSKTKFLSEGGILFKDIVRISRFKKKHFVL